MQRMDDGCFEDHGNFLKINNNIENLYFFKLNPNEHENSYHLKAILID